MHMLTINRDIHTILIKLLKRTGEAICASRADTSTFGHNIKFTRICVK